MYLATREGAARHPPAQSDFYPAAAGVLDQRRELFKPVFPFLIRSFVTIPDFDIGAIAVPIGHAGNVQAFAAAIAQASGIEAPLLVGCIIAVPQANMTAVFV